MVWMRWIRQGAGCREGRPDIMDEFRRKAETARRQAQAGVAQGYVRDAFEGREFEWRI